MSPEELFAAYPQITHAVSFVEHILCVPESHPESAWDMITRRKGPDDVVRLCKAAANDAATEEGGGFVAARAEMDHPQFDTYVRGKMGAC